MAKNDLDSAIEIAEEADQIFREESDRANRRSAALGRIAPPSELPCR